MFKPLFRVFLNENVNAWINCTTTIRHIHLCCFLFFPSFFVACKLECLRHPTKTIQPIFNLNWAVRIWFFNLANYYNTITIHWLTLLKEKCEPFDTCSGKLTISLKWLFRWLFQKHLFYFWHNLYKLLYLQVQLFFQHFLQCFCSRYVKFPLVTLLHQHVARLHCNVVFQVFETFRIHFTQCTSLLFNKSALNACILHYPMIVLIL